MNNKTKSDKKMSDKTVSSDRTFSEQEMREAFEAGTLQGKTHGLGFEEWLNKFALSKANGHNKSARGVSELKHLVSTTGIDLGKLISDVVPENSLLWKDSGTWFYYEDETTFDEGWEPEYMQEPSESFEKFTRRVIEALVEEELKEEDDHMVISTDLAIARSEC